ncbi:MAG: hypothetical protein U0547_09790 [Dehalococcoidia bacterium]
MLRTLLLAAVLLAGASAIAGVLPGAAHAAPAILAQPGCDPADKAAEAPKQSGVAAEPCSPTIDRAIATAKMNAALSYSAYLEGKGSKATVDAYEAWLRALTGEQPRAVVRLDDPSARVNASIQKFFWPYEQINSNYCGPATAMSILRFLGPATSKTPNKEGVRDQLTGVPETDQEMFAGNFWLATAKNRQTYWGEKYMPFTLNSWRGTKWYVQSAGPGLEGGTLTKEQALAAIKFDTDRSYPVAENVLYSNRTYYPAGFWPGVTYAHWDTVYGHYMQNGRQVVQVGQVYHDKRLPYDRFQDVDWETHWSAIGGWHGLVW